MYKYILFDLDGTITDSSKGITNCVKYALEAAKWEIPETDRLLEFIGPPLTEGFMTISKMSEKEAEGHRCAVMATDETKDKYICNDIVSAGHKDDELSVARNLYAILRDFDKQKVEYVYSESFETKNVGQAVMNRLIKAAGHKIVKLD